jgi:hypothetical protein
LFGKKLHRKESIALIFQLMVVLHKMHKVDFIKAMSSFFPFQATQWMFTVLDNTNWQNDNFQLSICNW